MRIHINLKDCQTQQALKDLTEAKDDSRQMQGKFAKVIEENTKLKEYIEQLNSQMGVPKSHYDALQS
jgi:predicted nuclease with TOPRIM domain